MITLKTVAESDLKDLAGLYEELTGTGTNQQALAQTYAHIAKTDSYILLGAYKDHTLAGTLMGIVCHDLVGECRPFMVIENVIVSRGARRQGIGKLLMIEMERIARERNCYYIIFVSGAQRKEAHEFYRELGFKDEPVEGYRKHLG